MLDLADSLDILADDSCLISAPYLPPLCFFLSVLLRVCAAISLLVGL
jgi:hypothetical protein